MDSFNSDDVSMNVSTPSKNNKSLTSLDSDCELFYTPPNSTFFKSSNTCICERKPELFVCVRCHHFYKGRIDQKCPKHIDITFPMDKSSCPYCHYCEQTLIPSTEFELAASLEVPIPHDKDYEI